MNKNLSLLALSGTLALGGLLGYGLNERGAAQNSPVAAVTTNQAASQAQGTLLETRAAVPAAQPSYDTGRARTESEANTVQVVKQRQDGLVYVSVTEADGSSAQAQMRQKLQDQFGGLPFDIPQDDSGPSTGTGSGFFVNAQGDIVTNNHVVDGASEITIRLHGNKQTYKAKVIARAPAYDLALIRAEGVPQGSIKPLPLGDSDKLDVGLKAIAMGAPFNLDFSVSEGIISSLERQAPVGSREVMQPVIQTDAAINPGNSGGPLLSSAGEVIGVNTQILTGGAGQSAGVGFAIPINTVKRLLPQLQRGEGQVIEPPSLGITFTDLSSLSQEQLRRANLPHSGALVQNVYPGSPAAAAGLRAGKNEALSLSPQRSISTDGDVVTAVEGQPVTDGSDLQQAVLAHKNGDALRLTVRRGSQTREVTVTLKAFTFPQNAGQE